eukprot:3461776-Rhodomonas_salina.1
MMMMMMMMMMMSDYSSCYETWCSQVIVDYSPVYVVHDDDGDANDVHAQKSADDSTLKLKGQQPSR